LDGSTSWLYALNQPSLAVLLFYNLSMKQTTADNKKLLKELNAELKKLQLQLAEANKVEGKDPYVGVKVGKSQARFERIKQKGVEDKAVGKFYIEIDITAKEADVYVPLSVASGKKVAGFMYQIEGTAEGSIVTTSIKVRGEGLSQITVGTLLYAKVPALKTGSFQIQAEIRGSFGKTYKIVFTRLNYKLQIADTRYQQYLKAIPSKSVKFS